jgi:hypothetical protein
MDVLPDGPTARGAATSWRVYRLGRMVARVLPLVGIIILFGKASGFKEL